MFFLYFSQVVVSNTIQEWSFLKVIQPQTYSFAYNGQHVQASTSVFLEALFTPSSLTVSIVSLGRAFILRGKLTLKENQKKKKVKYLSILTTSSVFFYIFLQVLTQVWSHKLQKLHPEGKCKWQIPSIHWWVLAAINLSHSIWEEADKNSFTSGRT